MTKTITGLWFGHKGGEAMQWRLSCPEPSSYQVQWLAHTQGQQGQGQGGTDAPVPKRVGGAYQSISEQADCIKPA